MKHFRFQISNFRFIVPLLMAVLLMSFLVSGCQKVDKPVRGEEGSSPMAIVIEGDPPLSHTENTDWEGNKLVNPYTELPVIGSLFQSDLEGLEYWKAYHPNLVTGLKKPTLIADPDEMCLDCHDQSTSCNNCHSYVGVGMVKGE